MIRRALVVDDEAPVRQVAMRLLGELGFQCVGACNGRLAQELVRKSNYDLVVTDLRMPELNGHVLAVDLLQQPNRPLIVVLTGVTEPRLEQDLRTRGVDEIIFKPIQNDAFAATIQNLMEGRKLREEKRAEEQGEPRVAEQPLPSESATKPNSSISISVSEVIAAYPVPPKGFDSFQEASDSAFDLSCLEGAMRLDSSLASLVLQLANSIVYFAQRTAEAHLPPKPHRDLLSSRTAWAMTAYLLGLLTGGAVALFTS
jgi:CheY-like chemotaxis protein